MVGEGLTEVGQNRCWFCSLLMAEPLIRGGHPARTPVTAALALCEADVPRLSLLRLHSWFDSAHHEIQWHTRMYTDHILGLGYV